LWDDLLALLRKEECLTESPPQPKGYSYYMGRRRKQAKKGTAYLIGDAAGLATVDLAEGIGPAVESGILAARDILGKGSYSLRAISRFTLPFLKRAVLRIATLAP
jgi:flavin-dependent dehydrogenase